MRDGYFPTIFDNNRLVVKIGREAFSPVSISNQVWQWALDQIYDSGTALACIASYLRTMAGLASESSSINATRLSLVLATRSSKLLHASLKGAALRSDARARNNLISHVYFLHRASLHVGDHASTVVHSKLLNDLIVRAVLEGDIDYMMLCYTALDSVNAANRFMSRTSFDHAWFARTCTPLWEMIERDLPRVSSEVYRGLSPNIWHEELRLAFLTSRHMNAYAEDPPPPSTWDPSTVPTKSVFGWFVSKGVWALSMATDVFLDIKDNPYPAIGVSPGGHLTQAALALALALQRRIMCHQSNISVIDMLNCWQSIMFQLRSVMTEVFASCTIQEFEEYADAHLWILFMGTFWERRSTALSRGEIGWFQEQLVERVLLRKKATWARLEPVLEKSAYSNWEEPNESEWWDDIAQEHLLRYC